MTDAVAPATLATAAPIAAAHQPGEPPRLRRTRRLAIILAVPLVLAAAAGGLWLHGGRWVETDNAYVHADKLAVAAEVGGVVTEVAVREGQPVAAGQLLFRLDAEPYRIALRAAEADRDAAAARIETLRHDYAVRLSEWHSAEAEAAFWSRQHGRERELAGRGASPASQLDEAQRGLDVARNKVDAASQQAAAILAQLGGSAGAALDTIPEYRQALARVERARRDLARTAVMAPWAGIATNVAATPQGSWLAPGQAAIALVSSDRLWIEANPKETDLGGVVSGKPVEVTVDAYPGVTWHGRVESVAPGTGGEFALLPPQNASGNWIKVVQRVPVRIAVETTADMPPLRAGMSANVAIDTGHQRSLGSLVGAGS